MTAAVQMDLLELLADDPNQGAEPTAPRAPSGLRRLTPVPSVKQIEAGLAEVAPPMRNWADDSLCSKTAVDDELWFPPHTGRGIPPHQEEVRAICEQCPVMRSCGADAYRNPAGVTGYRAAVYCGDNDASTMSKSAYRGLYAAATRPPAGAR